MVSAGALAGEGIDFFLSCRWFSFYFREEESEKLGQSRLLWGLPVIPSGNRRGLLPLESRQALRLPGQPNITEVMLHRASGPGLKKLAASLCCLLEHSLLDP